MYKVSRYNYYINHNNRVVYFNSLKGGLFSVSLEEHKKMTLLFEDLIMFNIQYNSVFDRMIKMGFVVPEGTNELDIIRLKNRNEVFANKKYKLFILPTLECNFNCWYCYEKHEAGHMGFKMVEATKAHIFHMIVNEKISALDLSWYGGEPLLYFEEVVYPISLYAKKICREYNIPYTNWVTTNGYLINKDMISKVNDIQLFSYQITIDGNREKHNKVRNVQGLPSFDKIINNIILLCENLSSAHITLRLNYDNVTLRSHYLSDIYEMIPPDCRKKVDLTFQRVWQTQDQVSSTSSITINDLRHVCRKMAYRNVDISGKFRVGKCVRCYADRYYTAVLNFDGKIYKCTSENFDGTNSIGQLSIDGKIENEDSDLLAKMFARSNFENEKCLNCKHLPICLGPCMKRKLADYDNSTTDCYLEPLEVTSDQFIIELFENRIRHKKSV